jgi:hypothetical protein
LVHWNPELDGPVEGADASDVHAGQRSATLVGVTHRLLVIGVASETAFSFEQRTAEVTDIE